MGSTFWVGSQPVTQSMQFPYLANPASQATFTTKHLAFYDRSLTNFTAPLASTDIFWSVTWALQFLYGVPIWNAATKPQLNPVNPTVTQANGAGRISL